MDTWRRWLPRCLWDGNARAGGPPRRLPVHCKMQSPVSGWKECLLHNKTSLPHKMSRGVRALAVVEVACGEGSPRAICHAEEHVIEIPRLITGPGATGAALPLKNTVEVAALKAQGCPRGICGWSWLQKRHPPRTRTMSPAVLCANSHTVAWPTAEPGRRRLNIRPTAPMSVSMLPGRSPVQRRRPARTGGPPMGVWNCPRGAGLG